MSPLCRTSTHPRFQSSLAYFVSSPSAPSPSPHAPGCFSIILCFLLPPDSLRVLQWNAGCLRARNTELLHFISFYSLNLICNLNSFSSFRIPGFSALRSDWAHSRSDLVLLMPCTIAAASTFSSNKVFSFCALSTSSLFLLDTNSDYVRVNTSLNNLPRSHSFLVHSPQSCFLLLPREALLAFFSSPPWNLPFFAVESTLSSPRFRFDFLYLAKVRLSLTLTLSHFTIWCSGQTTVRFPFRNSGSGIPANCSLCGTEATLSLSAGPVYSSFSAEACAILQTLCWSWHHQQVCHQLAKL